MGNILAPLAPLGTLFHYVFYEPVFNILMLVYGLVHNFALAIVVLTILIRVALIPLTRAQLKSQQEMQRLQPELKRIQQQYRGDMIRVREEQQALYKQHGVSPAKGCLPLLIQMPFLYALYYSFFTVLRPPSTIPASCAHLAQAAAKACAQAAAINNDIYPFLPHFTVATLPQTQFFWTNLISPDPLHILPVLAGVLTFLQLRMAMPVKPKQAPGAAPDPTTQATSSMQFIMPFITFFIGLGFPSGLALYWCFSTGFSAIQQYFINGRNFGSLFLGIPGFEHLVPPPKILTAATPALPATTGRGGSRGAMAVVSSTPEEPAPTGFRALVQQMRQLKEAMSAQAQGHTADGAQESIDATVAQDGANGVTREPRPARITGTSPYPPRRTRPTRESAKLVRPQPSEPLTVPSAGSMDGALPEDEISQTGKSSVNGKTVLPEQAIARDNAASNGVNGVNGANGVNGKAAGNGNTPSPSSQSNTASRSGNSNTPNYRKGASGRRGGRPKGGR